MTLVLILLAVSCLAYANGANDNFKGVATLFGSGTTDYRRALLWATTATLLGSLAAVFLAGRLLRNFSGKGLVADSLTLNAEYAAAVALGAGLTVLFATRIGMPVSTTHSLVGALVGAGWAAGSAIHFGKLGAVFFLPLIASPLLALAAAGVCYLTLHSARRWLGVGQETCFCVGNETVEVIPCLDSTAALQRLEHLTARIGSSVSCRNRYQGAVLGIEAGPALDWLHYLSAGIVSFARGLNDTPKISALLLFVPMLGAFGGVAAVGLTIALGGLLSARRVADVMSRKITEMNHGQGFTANLVTGVVVIGASHFGLPVSTTHVSCGALFGIGSVTGQAHWKTIRQILFAWLCTLPASAMLGALVFSALARW